MSKEYFINNLLNVMIEKKYISEEKYLDLKKSILQ